MPFIHMKSLPLKCRFIHTRYARSGMVMDAGEVVQW